MTFKDLSLAPRLLVNVAESGYHTPTPIQEATIPLVLSGKDVLGCAQTGTGKTAAFALPILQRLAATPSPVKDARVIRALILSPTRELAQQTYENIVQYSKGLPLKSCVIFGGVGQGAQVAALHDGAEIVVACPGRLMDLMGQGYVRLDWVETFVLDEADRMLDMGFIHDVRRVLRCLPEKRQNLLFSATMPPEVEKLAMDILVDPANVKVDPVTSTVEAIDQCLYYVDKVNKKHLLASLLRSEDLENALVFSRTRHGVDKILKDLAKAGIPAAGIHGDKSQMARQTALNDFKSGKVKVLIATDIAARGIDIAGLSHVINFDMPMEPEAYIHRIGRTGRAGRAGKAISFCCIDEVKQLGQVEKLIGKRLREEESEWPMEVLTPSEPKVREPRPAKVDKNGNAVQPRPQRAPGGKTVPAQSASRGKTAPAAPSSHAKNTGAKSRSHSAPSRQKIVISRDGSARSAGTGKPVQRINRRKG